MNPVYIVLIVVFIVIFLTTAILTICALPGWIKIPDNYLKILFSSLILEVIASVFLLFNDFSPSKHKDEYKFSYKYKGVEYKNENWVVLNDEGRIFQLFMNDLELGMKVENFSDKVKNSDIYKLVKKDGEYLVMTKDTMCIGRVAEKIIKDSLKLFDEIRLKENAFKCLVYRKDENNKWYLSEGEKLSKKWSLKIDLDWSTYTVSDSDTILYKESSGFGTDQRNLHSFKGSDGAFYLVRIITADNYTSNKHVTFIIIRTEIESKLN